MPHRRFPLPTPPLQRQLLQRQPAAAACLLAACLGLAPAPALQAAPPAAPAAAAAASQDPAALAVPYRLGPGDRLRSSLFRMEGYETTAEVLSDGTVTLPRLGSVPVWGLTINEARKRITTGYARFLRRPIVYLDLVAARPVRVSVSGEVQRPGLYSIGLGGTAQLASSGPGGDGGSTLSSSGPPTLVEALQRAGGLTAWGDLRRITVQRASGAPGSPMRSFTVDFWEVLQSGGPVANPLLVDGDSIRVPRAEQLSQRELLAVASSTFAPDTISVNVVGEVVRPGTQSIKANSPLSQALLAAGGLTQRAKAGGVRLLRLEPDGTIRQATIQYDPAAAMGTTANPPLQQGDVLVVERHGWARVNDSLRSAVEPVGPLLNAGSIFRLLGVPLF
jgi:polysaccharide export outer membrane protein